MFEPSTDEVMLGRNVEGRYVGAKLGSPLQFGRGAWKVVGVFESGGTSTESEVWCDVRLLGNDAKRPVPYSGLRVRVAPGADMDALARRIGDDPRYALEATPGDGSTTRSRPSRRTCSTTSWWRSPCWPGSGAAFGATNTMYAAVQARTAEIGTLRALGFSRATILGSFLIESLAVALLGFVIGGALAWLLGRLLSYRARRGRPSRRRPSRPTWSSSESAPMRSRDGARAVALHRPRRRDLPGAARRRGCGPSTRCGRREPRGERADSLGARRTLARCASIAAADGSRRGRPG